VTFSFRPLSLAEVHRRRAMRAEPLPFSSPFLSEVERNGDENEEIEDLR